MGKILLLALITCFFGGCVNRELTINTDPSDAVVILNDEELGQSPVTVSFNWYGDYRVRIYKPGYETLTTNQKLKAPWHDHFPFDLFAQIWPANITNAYTWNFELEQKQPLDQEQLFEKAKALSSAIQEEQ